jgi:DNA polymerase II small subunit
MEKKIIERLFEKGVLVSKELSEKGIDDSLFNKIKLEADLIVLNSDYATIIHQESSLVDWYEVDKYRVEAERDNDELYQVQLQQFKESNLKLVSGIDNQNQTISSLETSLEKPEINFSLGSESNLSENENKIEHQIENTTNNEIDPLDLVLEQPSSSVTLVYSYVNIPRKYVVQDFTNFFVTRYKFLEGLLRNRQELSSPLAINRLQGKKEKEKVSLIGLVDEIGETRNGNIIFTLEDITGRIKIFVSKNNKKLFQSAKDLVVDEVIGISGQSSENIVFSDNIVWPDIAPREIKKGIKEEYAIFLSDIHVGSMLFLEKEFERFLRWIRGESANEAQRDIANKVKYIIIAGDLVDGIGIYASQEEELKFPDIKEQYKEFCRLIKQIPLNKEIIICPGNHDAVHLAEPQPAFNKEFCPDLFELPNVILVTNPSMVNIGKTKDFSGFDILLYHGYSFDYYVANVESIRTNGGYHRADLIMKFLLKRRHLAPSFKSTPYYPSHFEDPLLIKKIPDFFVTGHIHYSCVANYRGVTMISGSCWQGKTNFQEKLGHEPEPARVPVVNLMTREIKVLRFM